MDIYTTIVLTYGIVHISRLGYVRLLDDTSNAQLRIKPLASELNHGYEAFEWSRTMMSHQTPKLHATDVGKNKMGSKMTMSIIRRDVKSVGWLNA